MKIAGDQIVLECGDEESILQEFESRAQKRAKLYHYTNLEALLAILNNKQLKFNRIDKVNDRQENELFLQSEVAKLVFVTCFSFDEEESIPLWDMYTSKANGIRIGLYFDSDKMKGPKKLFDIDKLVHVKAIEEKPIVLPLKGGKPFKEKNYDWSVDLREKDIIYDMNQFQENRIARKLSEPVTVEDFTYDTIYNMNAMGAIKDKAWDFEKESRIVAVLRTVKRGIEIPDYEHLLVPIQFDNLKKLEIIFDPWMSEEMKECVEEQVKKYVPEIPERKIICKSSAFDKMIRRKE